MQISLVNLDHFCAKVEIEKPTLKPVGIEIRNPPKKLSRSQAFGPEDIGV